MDFKKWLPELAVLGIFLAITYITFAPLYSGQTLDQYDIEGYKGMASEIDKFRTDHGEYIHWTNSGFSGMPTYVVSGNVFLPSNIAMQANRLIRKTFPNPSGILLIGLLCFYALARSLKTNRWLAVGGAIAFVLGTFVITSLEAGHTSKINAYAYSPLVLAGLVLLFKRQKYLLGLLALGFGLSAQIAANHIQITFYLFLICLCYGIFEVVKHVKKGDTQALVKASLFTLAGLLLAVGVNYNHLATTYNYSKESNRSGKSELSPIAGQGTNNQDQFYEYATGWSYTPLESMTLLIPRFMGGTSAEPLGEKSSWSNVREIPRQLRDNPPTYWGKLPGTSSPVYVGAVISLLFFLSFFMLKRFKWWVLIATLLMLLLGWGKFSPGVYDFFYYNFPFFNKFRTPMMALLMIGLLWPMMGMMGATKFFNQEDKSSLEKPVLISLGIAAGIVVVFGLLGSFMYGFNGLVDEQLRAGGFTIDMLQSLKADRIRLLRADSIRSLVFLAITGAGLWFYVKEKLKPIWVIAGISLLSFIDIALVNKRYITAEDYVESSAFDRRLAPDAVDKAILQDEDIHYRVFNNGGSVLSEATTSSNHKSIGGSNAAKLQRYNELFERQFGRENTQNILGMLNAKYTIVRDEQGQKRFQRNNAALGNAWFVNRIAFANSADEEMDLLGSTNFAETAILPEKLRAQVPASLGNTGNSVRLMKYHPERLEYQAKVNNSDAFIVFSEIFYQSKNGDGWKAFIDGEEVPIYRTNYLLRGLTVPPGDHTIVFEYLHPAFNRQAMVSKLSSGALVLLALGVIAAPFFGRKTKEDEPEA